MGRRIQRVFLEANIEYMNIRKSRLENMMLEPGMKTEINMAICNAKEYGSVNSVL